MIDQVLELIEYEGGTIIKIIVVTAIVIGVLTLGYNAIMPHKTPKITVTPMPQKTPITNITMPTITPTPLPPGTYYRYTVGQFGPNKQLVYNLQNDTPAVLDPKIGYKDDNMNMALGLNGNNQIIPCYSSNGLIQAGYYDTRDGKYHYIAANGTQITLVMPVDEPMRAAYLANQTYSIGSYKTHDGVSYGLDNLGYWIRLNDSQAIRFINYTMYPNTVGGLYIDYGKTRL